MKSRSSLALATLLWLAAPAAADPAAEARTAMESTISGVLAILQDGSLSLPVKKERIQEIAYGRFDFETMSKLVLKRDWKKFDAAQQQVEQQIRRLTRGLRLP